MQSLSGLLFMWNVAWWDSGIKGLRKSKSISYAVFVHCDLFFWLYVYRTALKNVRAFSFPGRRKAQDCPPAALPLPALKFKGGEGAGRPGTRAGSAPLGLQGWSQHTAATPTHDLPPLLPAQNPLPCPTKLFCPSLFTVLEDRGFVLWSVIKLGLLFISTLNYNFLGALGSHTQFPRGLCTLYWKYTSQHNFFSFSQGRYNLLTSVCAVVLSKYHQAIISDSIAHLDNPHWYWFFSVKIILHSKCHKCCCCLWWLNPRTVQLSSSFQS